MAIYNLNKMTSKSPLLSLPRTALPEKIVCTVIVPETKDSKESKETKESKRTPIVRFQRSADSKVEEYPVIELEFQKYPKYGFLIDSKIVTFELSKVTLDDEFKHDVYQDGDKWKVRVFDKDNKITIDTRLYALADGMNVYGFEHVSKKREKRMFVIDFFC